MERILDDLVVLIGTWHGTLSGIVATTIVLEVADMNDKREIGTVDRGE